MLSAARGRITPSPPTSQSAWDAQAHGPQGPEGLPRRVSSRRRMDSGGVQGGAGGGAYRRSLTAQAHQQRGGTGAGRGRGLTVQAAACRSAICRSAAVNSWLTGSLSAPAGLSCEGGPVPPRSLSETKQRVTLGCWWNPAVTQRGRGGRAAGRCPPSAAPTSTGICLAFMAATGRAAPPSPSPGPAFNCTPAPPPAERQP